MKQNNLRSLSPPGHTAASGTYVARKIEDDEEDEITSPGNPTFMLGQQFFSVFDNLKPVDQQLSIVLINAFAAMSPSDRKVLVSAAERMAGI